MSWLKLKDCNSLLLILCIYSEWKVEIAVQRYFFVVTSHVVGGKQKQEDVFLSSTETASTHRANWGGKSFNHWKATIVLGVQNWKSHQATVVSSVVTISVGYYSGILQII